MINAQCISGQSKGQIWLPEEFFQTTDISAWLWAGDRWSKVRPCYCQWGNSSFHGVSLANLPTPGVETQSPKAPHRHKCPWKANCWGIPAQLRHLPTHREEAEWTPLRKGECSEYDTITQTAAAVIAQWMFPFLRGCHVYQTILSLNYKTKNNMILLLYVFLHSLICSGVLNTQVLVRNRCLSFSILL